MKKILEVKDLRISFRTDKGFFNAVSNISYDLSAKEILGIVGESGCGKSLTGLSLLNLLPGNAVREAQCIKLGEQDLLKLNDQEMIKIRGRDISVIFQEPMTALNPLLKIGHQISESARLHLNLAKEAAMIKSKEMMKKVGLADVDKLYNNYPHNLSGGMRQRVMIAMAMICNPSLLLADEPTTALDVTIQAQILNLMKRLNQENGTAIIFISHDLGVIKEMCDQVMVMYLGYVVEKTTVKAIFNQPLHPYTKGLLNSIPQPQNKSQALFAIPGRIPPLNQRPTGCPFAPRCSKADDLCEEKLPQLIEKEPNHFVRCFYAD